jgi:thiamine-monophosphate kinase
MMPSKNRKISDLGEKKLIKRLLEKSQKYPFKSIFFDTLSFKSRSDDAAILNFGKNYLAATTDLLIQSTHFPRQMTPRQMGKKIVTVNVSDLAAMGAESLGFIVALALPPDLMLSEFDEILEGILEACENYQMALIGGDTNESTELALYGTCLGIVAKDKVMMKSGSQVGDVIAVTGPLGLAAAGFEILSAEKLKLKNINHNFKELALKHALEPKAQLEKGISCSKTGAVTSATDITDGLLSELEELIQANQTNIGMIIYEDKIPIPDEIFELASKIGKDPLEMALSYGEDFEILLTIKKDKFHEIKDKISLYELGYVTSSGHIQMIDNEEKTDILIPKGYEHFKKNDKF